MSLHELSPIPQVKRLETECDRDCSHVISLEIKWRTEETNEDDFGSNEKDQQLFSDNKDHSFSSGQFINNAKGDKNDIDDIFHEARQSEIKFSGEKNKLYNQNSDKKSQERFLDMAGSDIHNSNEQFISQIGKFEKIDVAGTEQQILAKNRINLESKVKLLDTKMDQIDSCQNRINDLKNDDKQNFGNIQQNIENKFKGFYETLKDKENNIINKISYYHNCYIESLDTFKLEIDFQYQDLKDKKQKTLNYFDSLGIKLKIDTGRKDNPPNKQNFDQKSKATTDGSLQEKSVDKKRQNTNSNNFNIFHQVNETCEELSKEEKIDIEFDDIVEIIDRQQVDNNSINNDYSQGFEILNDLETMNNEQNTILEKQSIPLTNPTDDFCQKKKIGLQNYSLNNWSKLIYSDLDLMAKNLKDVFTKNFLVIENLDEGQHINEFSPLRVRVKTLRSKLNLSSELIKKKPLERRFEEIKLKKIKIKEKRDEDTKELNKLKKPKQKENDFLVMPDEIFLCKSYLNHKHNSNHRDNRLDKLKTVKPVIFSNSISKDNVLNFNEPSKPKPKSKTKNYSTNQRKFNHNSRLICDLSDGAKGFSNLLPFDQMGLKKAQLSSNLMNSTLKSNGPLTKTLSNIHSQSNIHLKFGFDTSEFAIARNHNICQKVDPNEGDRIRVNSGDRVRVSSFDNIKSNENLTTFKYFYDHQPKKPSNDMIYTVRERNTSTIYNYNFDNNEDRASSPFFKSKRIQNDFNSKLANVISSIGNSPIRLNKSTINMQDNKNFDRQLITNRDLLGMDNDTGRTRLSTDGKKDILNNSNIKINNKNVLPGRKDSGSSPVIKNSFLPQPGQANIRGPNTMRLLSNERKSNRSYLTNNDAGVGAIYGVYEGSGFRNLDESTNYDILKKNVPQKSILRQLSDRDFAVDNALICKDRSQTSSNFFLINQIGSGFVSKYLNEKSRGLCGQLMMQKLKFKQNLKY